MCPFVMSSTYNLRTADSGQPTNHLDLEGLDGLMLALNVWNGGVIVISHDERFITSVAKDVRDLLSSRICHSDALLNTALGVRRWYSDKIQRRCRSIQGTFVPIKAHETR